MADLTTACNALATTLSTIAGLRVSPTFLAQVNPPAAVIMPQPAQSLRFDTLGGGISYLLRVVVLTSYTEDASSVALMNSYLATKGPLSVSAALQANPTLSGAVEYANLETSRGYGLSDWAGQTYLMAQFLVTVMAT